MNASIKTIERSLATRVTARRVANWGVLMVALGQVGCDDDPEPWAIVDGGGLDASVTPDGGGEPTNASFASDTTSIAADSLTAPIPNGSGSNPDAPDASTTESESDAGDTATSSPAASTIVTTEVTATETSAPGTDRSAGSSTIVSTAVDAGGETSTSEPTGESTSGDESGDTGTPQYANCYEQCSVDCFPDCLKDLFAGCEPSGACNAHDDGSYCWQNQWTATETGDIFAGYTRTIFAPSGDACYSAFRSTDIGAGIANFTWSDADSNVVATATWHLDKYAMRLTCADTGAVWDFEPPSFYCAEFDEYGWSVASCEPGSCPIPAGDAGSSSSEGATSQPSDASAPLAFD